MKIGLISDTHSYLSPNIKNIFQHVELIFHAGDIGDYRIIKKLKKLAPTHAVYGNTDIYSIASKLPSKFSIKIEGKQIMLIHNVDNIKNFAWKIKRGDFNPTPDIVIFGHTHQILFQLIGETYFINPGYAGLHTNDQKSTVMILSIEKSVIITHEVIDLYLVDNE